ncbi:MAG: hypothetical protein OXH86_17160 [Acidimicrobiaceae bacterium]|nr:hypothetical protein [Acidimicrobiaceae bacterium]MDE0499072.1 hypothetical protein [Acidimicrobiaceae bacterium]
MSDIRFAAASLVFGLAFLARVAGQAVQRRWDVAFLPSQDAWQGSSLPFPALFAAQVVILMIIATATLRMRAGRNIFGRRWVRPVAWLGVLYFAAMAARLAVGLAGDAGVFGDGSVFGGKWFTAYLPTIFHLVLAAEVLLLARYQRRRVGHTG